MSPLVAWLAHEDVRRVGRGLLRRRRPGGPDLHRRDAGLLQRRPHARGRARPLGPGPRRARATPSRPTWPRRRRSSCPSSSRPRSPWSARGLPGRGRTPGWPTHAADAPRDYGAILPPDLVEQGVAWQRLLFADGWAGIHWPVEYGGRGLTPAHNAAWIEECALRRRARRSSTWSASCWPAAPSSCSARPSSRRASCARRWPADLVWCQLFSEPGAGSDLGSLSTRAERDGDRFVVNGQKVWCSGGRYSDWGILMARTDPSLPKHKGISFFLLDMRLPGVEVRPLQADDRRGRVRRGVLHRRRGARRLPARPAATSGWNVGHGACSPRSAATSAPSVIGLERRLEAHAPAWASGRRLDAVERQRARGLLGRGTAYSATRPSARDRWPRRRRSLMKLGITELMFDAAMLRGDLAGQRRLARRPGGVGHAGGTRRPHRRRHQPGAAQHHRGAPARTSPGTEGRADR